MFIRNRCWLVFEKFAFVIVFYEKKRKKKKNRINIQLQFIVRDIKNK